MDLSKINLDAPAFGPGSQTLEETQEPKVEEKPVETLVEEQPKVEEEEVQPEASDEEEGRVRYSRFKNVLDRAKESERIAQEALEREKYWREIAEHSKSNTQEEELDPDWVEAYGDSDASRKLYKKELARREALMEETKKAALEAVRAERLEEATRVESNEEYIDTQLDELEKTVGRHLTQKEEEAILDIVDEYTPKDREGNYAGDLISFDKAWEIYELKNQTAKAPKIQSRNNVAALTSSQNEGNTNVGVDKDKDFNPLNWDAWRKRV